MARNHKYIFKDSKKIDLDQLVEHYKYGWWSQNRKKADVKKMLQNSDVAISLWDGKKLIGFARILTDYVYRATLWDVIIHPDYQGQGLGKLIMDKVLNHPKLKKVSYFWLITSDKQKFYKKLGWKMEENWSMYWDRKANSKGCPCVD